MCHNERLFSSQSFKIPFLAFCLCYRESLC